MHFYNIHNSDIAVPIETVLKIGKNRNTGGFYVPTQIPLLNDSLIYKNPPPSFREVAFEISRAFFCDLIPETDLYTLIAEAFPFKVPVFPIDPRTYILELTHGESGSCTDFGARFTAQLITYFHTQDRSPLHILFTGGETQTLSLAKAFSEYEQLHCTFLYPKDSLPHHAEQQLLSLPQNIHAFAVDGSLDDCKKMVREAASDTVLRDAIGIFLPDLAYIGYLLAYTFCCVYASLVVLSRSSYDNSIEKPDLIMSFPLSQPSGLSAAVLAKKMNAPIAGFITTANASDVLPHTLLQDFGLEPADQRRLDCFEKNFGCEQEYARLKMLCGGTNPALEIALYRLRQQDIIEAMRTCNDRTGVIISPYAAEIWQAWNTVRIGFTDTVAADNTAAQGLYGPDMIIPRWIGNKDASHSCISIIAETSHPALHTQTVKAAIGREPPIPYRFECNPQTMHQSVRMPASAAALQDWLRSLA